MSTPRDYYYHSHTSVNDGSPAMVLSYTWTEITLQNEDGHVWTDPIENWVRIENPVFPPEWDDEDDDEPVEDWTDIDYPEYDAQTDFYNATGRMQFPNEY